MNDKTSSALLSAKFLVINCLLILSISHRIRCQEEIGINKDVVPGSSLPSSSSSSDSLTVNNNKNNNNEDEDFDDQLALMWFERLERQLEQEQQQHSPNHPPNFVGQDVTFVPTSDVASSSHVSEYFVDDYPIPLALKNRIHASPRSNLRYRTRRYPFTPGLIPATGYRRKARIGSDVGSSRMALASPGSFQLASFLTDSYGLKDGRGVRFGLS